MSIEPNVLMCLKTKKLATNERTRSFLKRIWFFFSIFKLCHVA